MIGKIKEHRVKILFVIVVMIILFLSILLIKAFVYYDRNESIIYPKVSDRASHSHVDDNRDSKFYEGFADMLIRHGFLPKAIVDDMKDFRKENIDDGSVLYIWSSWDDEKDDFIHNIQLVIKDNEILQYI